MTDQIEIPDYEFRREAVLADGHAFVWASAGTGKTHTLALRALFQVFKLAPESLFRSSSRTERLRAASSVLSSVVLTTFTRKAAAEMHTRLYDYLRRIVDSKDYESCINQIGTRPDPLFAEIITSLLTQIPSVNYRRLRYGAVALTERFNELQVSTLHGFAAALLRRHPMESGLPINCRFAEEDSDDVAGIEEQVVARWWRTEALRNPSLRNALEKVLEVIPLSDVQNWLHLIYLHPWIVRETIEIPGSQRIAGEQEAIQAIESLCSGLPAAGSRLARTKDEIRRLLTDGQDPDWVGLANFVQQNKQYLFLKPQKAPKAVIRTVKNLLDVYQHYFESHWKLYDIFLRKSLRHEMHSPWQAWKQIASAFGQWAQNASSNELGLVTFDEMIRSAVEILQNNPRVQAREQRRLRAILVDEFQDTDREQLELLKLLLRRPKGSKHEAQSFFVGDLKQSIYRFRGADVPAVAHFFKNFSSITRCRLPKAEYHLVTSFRSQRSLTNFTNRFFSEAVPLAEDREFLAPARLDSKALPVWIQLEQQENKQIKRIHAAEAVVGAIYDYFSTKTTAGPLPYGDIMVLSRDNRELDILIPVLNEAGIPVLASGVRTFFRQQEVLDVLNLLIALYHPGDSAALAAVLLSPTVGLDETTVYFLFEQIPPQLLLSEETPLPDFLPILSIRRIGDLRDLFRKRLKTVLPLWLHSVQCFLPKTHYISSLDPDGRAYSRISKVFHDFKLECLHGVTPPIEWLLAQRARSMRADRWDAQLGEDISISDEQISAVRVMTVHKAKGLEAPFVILYGWEEILNEIAGKSSKDTPQIINTTGHDGTRYTGFCLRWGPLSIVTPGFAEAKRVDARNAQSEATRLAYVAVTRARDDLILLHSSGKEGTLSDPSTEKFLNRQNELPTCLELIQWRPRDRTRSIQFPRPITMDRNAHRSLWKDRIDEGSGIKKRLLLSPSEFTNHLVEEGAPPTHMGSPPEESLSIGKLVHSYLEKYIMDSTFVHSKLEELAEDTVPSVAKPSVIESCARILGSFFSGELKDPDKHAYKNRIETAKILGREVPFFISLKAESWTGVIDLVFESNGEIFAVDYKTTSPKHPLPASYLEQQRIYSQALRQLFPETKINFEFWWLVEASTGLTFQQELPF